VPLFQRRSEHLNVLQGNAVILTRFTLNKYMAVDGTSAFYVFAKSDIAAGDEITVDYGRSYFDDGVCPCHTCAQPSPIDQPATFDKEGSLENDLKRKKRERRLKRKQKQRLRAVESADREGESESD